MKFLFNKITAFLDFVQKYFKTIVFIFIVILISENNSQNQQKANLQRIDLNGMIVNSDEIVEKIFKSKEDKNIKGVLFVINSPGGSVAPSIEISNAIKELNKINLLLYMQME